MIRTSVLQGTTIPLVVETNGRSSSGASRQSTDACFAHLLDERELLQRLLLEHGALLLRGCPVVNSPAEFAHFVREFSGKSLLDYAGGASPRVRLGEGVYTSTEYPSRYALSLHNELSYTSEWPEHLFFCCVTPAETGGETPVGDSRAILKKIDARIVSEFKRKKIKYVRNLHGGAGTGYSWQEAFETEDRAAVERFCRARRISYAWRPDGGLTLTETRPSTAVHPLTGEEVWFNQADGFHPSALDEETYSALRSTMTEEEFRLNSYFGDGSSIDPAALAHVRAVLREASVPVPWQAGDILVLDNMLAAHGRMPFKGARKILLAMT